MSIILACRLKLYCFCMFSSAKLAAAAAEKVANADGDLQHEHNRQFMNATEVTATNKNALFDAWHATYDSRKAEIQRKPKLDDFLNRYSLFLRNNETVICFVTHRILKEVNLFFFLMLVHVGFLEEN